MIAFLVWWEKKRHYFSALSEECYNGCQRTGRLQKSFARIIGYDRDLIRTWMRKVEGFLAGKLQAECRGILVVSSRSGHVKHQWVEEVEYSSISASITG
jgi:hypothetical protein